MHIGKHYSLLALALLTVFTFYSSPTDACSCMPSHPQTHFCDADYVVVVRVLKKSHRLLPNKVVFKVEVKKSYKMNDKGHKILKHGRLVSSNSTAACGVELQIGKLYMIAGHTTELNLCTYIKEYLKMSVIERRGFAGVYRKSCKCNVTPCFGSQCLQERESATSCQWSPFAKCETDFSACMPTTYATREGFISKCHWRKTPAYKACLADP